MADPIAFLHVAGRNDFFPFNRAELAQFDPEGLRMCAEVWGVAAP